MRFLIRPATAGDAEAIGELTEEFVEYLRVLGDPSDLPFDGETYLRDGFGPNPAFSGLVAESDGEILGYLLYYPGYEIDDATHMLHIIDLYVTERWRHRGIGRALMEKAAEICRRLGGTQLFWAVYVKNESAFAFYERLGARYTRGLRFMRLDV